MLGMLTAWVGIPLILTVTSLGLGLLVAAAVNWLRGTAAGSMPVPDQLTIAPAEPEGQDTDETAAVVAATPRSALRSPLGAKRPGGSADGIDALLPAEPEPLVSADHPDPTTGDPESRVAEAGDTESQPRPDQPSRRSGAPAIATLALIPLGLAAAVVVTTILTALSVTAPGTPIITLALAALGLVLGGRSRLPIRVPRTGLAAVGVYLVYSAPAALAGGPSFAGWIKLDDGSTWLAFTDRLIANGRVLTGLQPSTYEATLALSWTTDYPLGAFPLLGMAARVLGLDAAFALQPYMAWLAAVLALTLGAALARQLANREVRAIAVFLAAQPALLLGYSLWGGVKELVLAPLVALLAVTVGMARPIALRGAWWWQLVGSVLPLAITGAAIVLVAGISGLAWMAGAALVLVVRWMRAVGWAGTAAGALGALVLLLALSAPQLSEFKRLAQRFGYAAVGPADGGDIGNLWGRLPVAQLTGIWPVGDFRATPANMTLVWLLIAGVLALAVVGAVGAWQERQVELPTYVITTVPLAAWMATSGGVWVAGKAMAIASPALLTAAVAGCGWLLTRDRFAGLGGFAFAALGVTILTSSWLAYRSTWLAPADQLAELSAIGADSDLRSPALMLDYSPYGARHFLRQLDTQGAGELRRDVIPTRTGVGLERAAYGDIDDFPTYSLAKFNTLVLRNSVRASRPPADWQLAREGRYYDVWERNPQVQVLAHINLGDPDQPAAVPKCSVITDLAKVAPAGTELAYVVRDPVVAAVPGPLPAGWTAAGGAIKATSSGSMTFTVTAPEAGTYYGWLAGSFRGHMRLSVGDQVILDERQVLNWTGHGTPTQPVALPAGPSSVTLEYELSALRPGEVGNEFNFGPLLFAQTSGSEEFQTVKPAQAEQLCGRPLDWVAVIQEAG